LLSRETNRRGCQDRRNSAEHCENPNALCEKAFGYAAGRRRDRPLFALSIIYLLQWTGFTVMLVAPRAAIRHCENGRAQRPIASGHLMSTSNASNPPEDDAPNLNGMRILVVEDSWHLGTALKSLLQAWGAEVVG